MIDCCYIPFSFSHSSSLVLFTSTLASKESLLVVAFSMICSFSSDQSEALIVTRKKMGLSGPVPNSHGLMGGSPGIGSWIWGSPTGFRRLDSKLKLTSCLIDSHGNSNRMRPYSRRKLNSRLASQPYTRILARAGSVLQHLPKGLR